MLKKLLATCMGFLLLALQYKLWLAPGGWLDAYQLRHQVEVSQESNDKIAQQNAMLLANVESLKKGYDRVDEQARLELGMIKQDETYYRFI